LRHLPHLGEAQPDSFGRESDRDIEIRFAAGPDAVDDIENGPAPSRQIAAEFIFPAVDLRAEKLAENIAVRPMHLDAIEAGGLGPLGGQDEILHQRPDLAGAQGPGAGLLIGRGAIRLLADQRRRRPHARMVQLHHGDAVLGLDGGGHARQSRQMVVGKSPELARETLAGGLDVGGAGHGQPKTARGAHLQPLEFIVR